MTVFLRKPYLRKYSGWWCFRSKKFEGCHYTVCDYADMESVIE